MKSLRLIFANNDYLSIAIIFASLNVWFGTWAIYIPYVQEKIQLSKADLGFSIFFLSLGVFTTFPLVPKLIHRIGAAKVTWVGVILASITLVGPFLAHNQWQLCLALYLFGIANGITDIAMNTLVTELEKRDKVQFMSAAHGFFSLGGVLVGLGSLLMPIINNPLVHVLGTIVIVFLINLFYRKYYFDFVQEWVPTKGGINMGLISSLFLLGIIGFVSMASEGAIVDWSALFLKEVSVAPERYWGAGFLGFSVFMTLGRFFGDRISERMGSYRLIALGALFGVMGFGLVLFKITILAILGFALCGLGFSVMVPELFRIGGKAPGVSAAQGVAFIAGIGYVGFLSGPVILGFLAESKGLMASMSLLLFTSMLVLIISVAKAKR